jgi:hypothetical protein
MADTTTKRLGWIGGRLVEGAPARPPLAGAIRLAQNQAAEPTILFGRNVDPASLSPHSLERIRANAAALGVTQLQITSTQRDAPRQAGAMYDNLIRQGERAQRQGYNANGNAVIDVAMAARQAGLSREAAIQAMVRKIDDIRAADPTAFKHMMDPARLQAVDILPESLRGPGSWDVLRDGLLSRFRSDKAISKALGPDRNDRVIHIEIPQD